MNVMIVPTGREPREFLALPPQDSSKKTAVCEPGRGSPLLDLGLPAPKTVGNKCLLCKQPQSMVFWYNAQAKT